MRTQIPVTESDILDEIIASNDALFSPTEARSFLKLRFKRTAVERIRKLLRKNNAGTIRDPERMVLDNYLRVGQFLDLLHAKAKLSLAHRAKGR